MPCHSATAALVRWTSVVSNLLRVGLNESGVWLGGKYNGNQHDAYKHLPEIRRLIFEDRIVAFLLRHDRNGIRKVHPVGFSGRPVLC